MGRGEEELSFGHVLSQVTGIFKWQYSAGTKTYKFEDSLADYIFQNGHCYFLFHMPPEK